MDRLNLYGNQSHPNASRKSIIQIRCDYDKSHKNLTPGTSAIDTNPESAKRQKRSHSELTQTATYAINASTSNNTNSSTMLNLNNRFSLLDDDVTESNVEVEANNSTETNGSKKSRCPPITIADVSTRDLREFFTSQHIPQDKYHMKTVKNGVQLVIGDKQLFQQTVSILKQAQVQYFTYVPSEEVPIKIVLSGLPMFDLIELEKELNDCDIHPTDIKVLSVRKNGLEDNALYLLYFRKGTVKLQELRKVKALFNVIVRWRYFVKKMTDVVQCHRCQRYGHGKSNCNMLPLCVKCGEKHETIQCQLPAKAALQDKERANRAPVKCANCSGNHTANFRGCPTRKDYLQQLEDRAAKKKANMLAKSHQLSGSNGSRRHVVQSRDLQQRSENFNRNQPLYSNVLNHGHQQSEGPASDLFSISEFLCLARDLFQRLQGCRNKQQQFLALSELMIKYVYNG